jgi:hypothetical protein
LILSRAKFGNGLVLTSIGGRDGKNSQETLLIMLELVTESLSELSRCATINADISITLDKFIQ